MILSENVFDDVSLNIFTDASIRKIKGGETLGCAGMLAVYGNDRKSYDRYQIIRNTTNNNAEIKAIRLGVEEAIRQKNNFKNIRLFSDSQISIFGIRDRIFKWYNNGSALCGYEGQPIKNQEIMLEIAHMIVDNDIRIDFYHQQGHVKVNDKEKLLEAIHVFSSSNNIRSMISYDFINTISQYNNYVDIMSRTRLYEVDEKALTQNPDLYSCPIYFTYNGNFNKDKYKKCISSGSLEV